MRSLMATVLVALCLAGTAARAVPNPVPATPAAAAPGGFIVLCYHEVRDDVRDYPDPFAVDSAALVAQFGWLRQNGYTPVSLERVISARSGGAPLPPKAVLLTFDDGYLSFYTRVYPLLRAFNYPAVLGVVGAWIDNPQGGSTVLYGEKASIVQASFPTWSQLREMADSGLVEMASHTYDLHKGMLANPQQNLEPAATARAYDAAGRVYEDDAAWRLRVRADLARNSEAIERGTGRRPRAVVWPYGSYNDELVRVAGELGMPVALTLEDGVNTPEVPLTRVRRTLVEHNPSLAAFAAEVRGPLFPLPTRVVQVNLEQVYSADPAQQERNLSALLDRVQALRPTHVYLRATDAEGAYFPARGLPLRADLFNRVAWQLATRTDVKVYAVLPAPGPRVSYEAVAGLYADLARHASFSGVVFENSDAGAGAVHRELVARALAFRAPLKTVVVTRSTDPATLAALAGSYDYVAVDTAATPGADIAILTADPVLRRKVVFLLRTQDGGRALARDMRTLETGGALNFGYATDDFIRDEPPLAQVAPAMSLREYPLAGRK